VILLLSQLSPGPVLDFARQMEARADFGQAGVEFYRYATYWPGDSLAPYALFRAGLCYGKAGEFAVARSVFTEYLASGYPKPEYARLEIARILLAQGDPGLDTLLPMLEQELPGDAARLRAWKCLAENDPGAAKEALRSTGLDSLARALDGFPHGPTPALAGALSLVVPGAGQVYYGHPGDAFMAFVFSVGLAGLSYYYLAEADRPVPGIVVGGFAAFFWLGQAYGAYVGARSRRHHLRENHMNFLKTVLFQDIYTPEFFR